MTGEARAHRYEISDCHPLGQQLIVHAELREILAHLPVPIDLALFCEDGQRRHGERLADRRNREFRVNTDWKRGVDVAQSISFDVDHLSSRHDRDRHARNAPGHADRIELRVETSVPSRLLRRGQAGREQEQQHRTSIYACVASCSPEYVKQPITHLAVIPSEGAKRRSRGIAVILAEWLSIGTTAIPRLAALARNDSALTVFTRPTRRASAARSCHR